MNFQGSAGSSGAVNPSRARISTAGLAAVLFLAACLTFSGSAGFGLVWDDGPLFQQVESALSEGETGRLFTRSFHVKVEQSARYYRPVMMATLLFDEAVSGGEAWFSHLVNILLHAFNSILVFMFFRRVLASDSGAFAGALLFAVHPVHAEAVSVVSSRMDLLALTLLLPAAILFGAGGKPRPQAGWLVRTLALLSFFLACLTKETAFMLPLVLLALFILREGWSWKRGLALTGPVFLTAAGAFLLRFAIFAGEPLSGSASGIRAGQVLPGLSIPGFVKLLVVQMRMAVHPFPERFHWFSGDFHLELTTILFAAAFVVLAALAIRKDRDSALSGLVWWSGFVLPVLGLVNLGQSLAAERYAYIPSLGVCLMAGSLAVSLPFPAAAARLLRVTAAGAAVLLMTAAAVHSRTWKDEITLFSRVVETNPSYADGYVNLGSALAREGRHEEALSAYDKAQSLAPEGTDAAFNRGNLLESLGRHEEALASFDRVLEKRPDDWEAFLNRGNVLAQMGRIEEARQSYGKALVGGETSGKPLVGLGVLAAREGKFEEALDLFRGAAAREPGLSEAYEGMGEALLALRRPGEAKRALLSALEAWPENVRAALTLGGILMREQSPLKALPVFRAALASDPSSIGAWAGLIRASEASGADLKEVLDRFREMAAKDPALAEKVRQAVSGSFP